MVHRGQFAEVLNYAMIFLMENLTAFGDQPKNDASVEFLSKSAFGRFLYNVILFLQVPKILGVFLRSPFSRGIIPGFIKKNNIDMSAFEGRKFKSFNDFFTRKNENIAVDVTEGHLISPSDSFLSVYKISKDSTFNIKGFDYTLRDFFESDAFDEKFLDGDCLIFRLCANDYHRFCYIDSGSQEENHFIRGKLYSVQPVTCENIRVYTKNRRSWTILHTAEFGDVAQIEVGAFSVGGIVNHLNGGTFTKGQEKGYFDLHGSTIVMLFEKGKISLLPELAEAVKDGREYRVLYGQQIGTKL